MPQEAAAIKPEKLRHLQLADEYSEADFNWFQGQLGGSTPRQREHGQDVGLCQQQAGAKVL